MRKIIKLAALPLFALALGACQVEQTEEGELPDVDVEGGKLPEYDVQTATVEVGTDTTRVITPDVDVNMPRDTTP